MSVERKLTDNKSIVTNTTTTNSSLTKANNKKKNNNSSSSKNLIKKALKKSKTKNTTTNSAANKSNNSSKNTNNQNTSKNNKTSSISNSSNGNNNNTEVANDEIIEEFFDFSDADLKELENNDDSEKNVEIRNKNNNDDNHSTISTELVKEADEVDKKSEEVHMHSTLIGDNNNNNHHNNEKEAGKESEQQVVGEPISLPIDNIDKQNANKKEPREGEFDLAKAATLNIVAATADNVLSKVEGNIKGNNEIDNSQPKQTESSNAAEEDVMGKCGKMSNKTALLLKTEDDPMLPNQVTNGSTFNKYTEQQIPSDYSSHKQMPTTSSDDDIKSKQTNDNNATSDLYINKNKESSHYEGDDTNDDGADDDDYAEPYDELLVQFLGEANQIAEARLAARRHARAEAREIRMRELERQQKEQESNADRVFDMHSNVTGITPLSHMRLGLGSSPVTSLLNSTRGNSMSSRRSSEDSLEEEGRSLRDIRHELKDVEERFRKAMIANAQLDNDRASQTYQIQLLKDKLEDMEESYSQLQRECKEKTRDCNALKRSLDKLNEELKLIQGQLNERDTLITEQGLVIVAIENEDGTDAKRALVSVENAQLLGSVQGSLDVRLKKFSEEKQQLQAEVQQLQEQLEKYKSQGKGRGKGNSSNGPLGSDDDEYEAQREANKIISDYKYKLQKAEQEIASLQSSLARSETQVIRYKSTAEAAEKAEAELKIERRKLQRENREAMEKLEELETSNNHLLKRLDKLKNAKSALLKDL